MPNEILQRLPLRDMITGTLYVTAGAAAAPAAAAGLGVDDAAWLTIPANTDIQGALDAVDGILTAGIAGTLVQLEVTIGAAGVVADVNFDAVAQTETLTVGTVPAGAVLLQRPYIQVDALFPDPGGGDLLSYTVDVEVGGVSSYTVAEDVFTGAGLTLREPDVALSPLGWSPIDRDIDATALITHGGGGITLDMVIAGLVTVRAAWLVP